MHIRTPCNPGAASYREKTQFVDIKVTCRQQHKPIIRSSPPAPLQSCNTNGD